MRGYIHARSIAAVRGLDLQLTAGFQSIRIGVDNDLVSAVVLYAWARQPEKLEWEKYDGD